MLIVQRLDHGRAHLAGADHDDLHGGRLQLVAATVRTFRSGRAKTEQLKDAGSARSKSYGRDRGRRDAKRLQPARTTTVFAVAATRSDSLAQVRGVTVLGTVVALLALACGAGASSE